MPCNKRRAFAAAVCLSMSALAAQAGDGAGFSGFRSPSGNIHCMFDPGYENVPPNIRCDLKDIQGAVPQAPPDCDGEWGRSFGVEQNAQSGKLLCTGDAVFNDAYPVLDYGRVWQQSGFTCTSEQSGVSCFNAQRHGFTLSRSSRQVF